MSRIRRSRFPRAHDSSFILHPSAFVPSSFILHPSAFSLLEVLIAILVISVGVFGVISLVPVGMFQFNESVKANRSWDAATSATREIQVRGLLEPDPDGPAGPGAAMMIEGGGVPLAMLPGQTYAVDPLRVPNQVGLWPFPYVSADDVNFPVALRIPRVTLRTFNHVLAGQMSVDQAARSFIWPDDIEFNVPDDAQLRSLAIPTLNGEPNSAGDYSWMFTVTPTDNPRRFYVSIVVFYKRAPQNPAPDPPEAPPGERTVFADLVDGLSADNVLLRYNPTANPPNVHYLEVRPNSWLFLSGYRAAIAPMTQPVPFHAWYRIVGVESIEPGEPVLERLVTLDGSDLDATQLFDLDNTQVLQPPIDPTTCVATLFDSVIAVFERTIDLDR